MNPPSSSIEDPSNYDFSDPDIPIKNPEFSEIFKKFVSFGGPNFFCGFFSGTVIAVIFNPWDRALYLSLKNNLPFLNRKNWSKPFQGCTNTLFYRAFSSGLYFPFESYFSQLISKYLQLQPDTLTSNFLAGSFTGMLTAITLHPLAVVKYHQWGMDRPHSRIVLMFKEFWIAGPSLMYRSISSTLLRDMIFGSVFSLFRHAFTTSILIHFERIKSNRTFQHEESTQWPNQLLPVALFLGNSLAATFAVILSSPFNYIRNIKFMKLTAGLNQSIESGKLVQPIQNPTAISILERLHNKAWNNNHSYWKKLHLYQYRLRIGWGSLRVAIGMGLASQIYQACCSLN